MLKKTHKNEQKKEVAPDKHIEEKKMEKEKTFVLLYVSHCLLNTWEQAATDEMQ